jgi:hypothetical protein
VRPEPGVGYAARARSVTRREHFEAFAVIKDAQVRLRGSTNDCSPTKDRIELPMSRPFIPSAVLTVLALAGQVRPRFMDDWPQLSDANLI